MGDPVSSLPSPEISSMAEDISSPTQVCSNRTSDLEKKRKFQGQLQVMEEILPSSSSTTSSSACCDMVAESETGPSSSSSGISPKRLRKMVGHSSNDISSGASNAPTADSSPHDIEASAASSSSFIQSDCDESGYYYDENFGNNDDQWITALNLPAEIQGPPKQVITIDKEFEEYFSQLLL